MPLLTAITSMLRVSGCSTLPCVCARSLCCRTTMVVYSIDEAFLDMTSFARFDLTEYSRLIRRTVRQHTGIPVCVGIAPTKTLAKIANRLAKKNPYYQGVCVLRSTAEIQAALKHTKVEDIWGIGRQWSKLLQAKRIESAADLAAAPAAWVRSEAAKRELAGFADYRFYRYQSVR